MVGVSKIIDQLDNRLDEFDDLDDEHISKSSEFVGPLKHTIFEKLFIFRISID